MLHRHIAELVVDALKDSPVVLLNGARQTGKSTLAQALIGREHPARYLTLDDPTLFAAASSDPAGFLANLGGPVVIDEVQRVPELFRAIKAEVDRNRAPGRFLLTGSADVLLLPRMSESLAGRMDVNTLWPLSQGEIGGHREGFIDAVFSSKLKAHVVGGADRAELVGRVVRGGFPEPLSRASAARRSAWYTSYLATVLSRDARDIANIEGLTALPRLLSLLAARTGSLLNASSLSRDSGLPQSTLKRYLALLETLFFVQLVPAWSSNLGKRLVRSPKIHLIDSGLGAHLSGFDEARLNAEGELLGPLLENFVVMELRKQQTWSTVRTSLLHFRSHGGDEVDVVLEDASGRAVGIEVKATASVGAQHFKGLHAFAEAAGKRFLRGVVLHTGRESAAFGSNMLALPMNALWSLS